MADVPEVGATVNAAGVGRRALVASVLEDPPRVHPEAVNGAVWSTQASCYRFMADHVDDGSRTLETGAGLSTVLFAGWGCRHLCVVPSRDEADLVTRYCAGKGIDTRAIRFDLRPASVALPELDDQCFDLVFVDGSHGFPAPIIDWFYGAGRLRRGGVLVLDDLQLPQVRLLATSVLDPDPRWRRLAATGKWAAYERRSEGSLDEGEWEQPWFPRPHVPMDRRLRQVARTGSGIVRRLAGPHRSRFP